MLDGTTKVKVSHSYDVFWFVLKLTRTELNGSCTCCDSVFPAVVSVLRPSSLRWILTKSANPRSRGMSVLHRNKVQ